MVDQLARGLDLHRHLAEAELQRLVLEDRLAEGDALLGVVQCRLEGGARHADRLRGDADAPAFQAESAIFRPWPSSPSRLATGTRQWSNTICAVSLACWPIFSSTRATT